MGLLKQHASTGELSTENFTAFELRCKCDQCKGKVMNQMDPDALHKHQQVRTMIGFPARLPPHLSRAYRCADHPDEVKKDKPGDHHDGTAIDYQCDNGYQKGLVVKAALSLGATAIGVYSWGVHVGFRKNSPLVVF